MKHIKLKARRMSEKDKGLCTVYEYETVLEVNGVEIENVTKIELTWDVGKDVPLITITVIPDTLELDGDVE